MPPYRTIPSNEEPEIFGGDHGKIGKDVPPDLGSERSGCFSCLSRERQFGTCVKIVYQVLRKNRWLTFVGVNRLAKIRWAMPTLILGWRFVGRSNG